ncbi:histone-like DNA-binding protein HU [Asaia bogorensis NBRC 16594]|nr:histone-like DNA-binding protein HU [Asaia bogorensis NBRC 16594]
MIGYSGTLRGYEMEKPLNKQELIAAVAEKTDLPKAKAGDVVEALFASIEEALARKQEVRLVGFGSFATATRKAAKGRNPRTGEEIDIPASVSVRFRPGKGLKDAVS